jgi:hypothetical protein
MLDRFAALADKFEADAAGVRGRAGRASPSSQRIMNAEAAALERVCRSIRQQIETSTKESDDAP